MSRDAILRKGAADAIEVRKVGRRDVAGPGSVDPIARHGATPWWSPTGRVLGVVDLHDIVKGGIHDRFAELRRMGIKTIMVTGDNPLDRGRHRSRSRRR